MHDGSRVLALAGIGRTRPRCPGDPGRPVGLPRLAPRCRLQEATREAEEQGEQLLAQLGSGELGLEAFVERYTRAQATYHQRDLKLQAAQQTLPSLQPR